MPANLQESNYLVLIVDDEPFIRIQLRFALQSEGYRTVEAQNGRQALTIFQQLRPDIVLLDTTMPNIDGFECCAQLQSLDYGQSTPVLMMTELEDQKSIDRAFAAGAIDCILKPIYWPILRQRVKLLIQQSQMQQQIELTNQKLQQLVTIDGLTQVSSRRWFEEYLYQEWQRLAREQQPLSLILCDVDFFKSYNDTYGHLSGDRCLFEVATAIKDTVKRPADLVARYGGEEFAVILPSTDIDGAVHVAENICLAIRKLGIPHINSQISAYVTISAGVATNIPLPGSEYQKIIAMADRALYLAKAGGRDRSIHDSLRSSFQLFQI